MNGILVDSNVYYLPVAPALEPDMAEPQPPDFTSRLRNAGWRLRLAFTEIRGILRTPRRRFPAEHASLMGETFAVSARRSRPALVIDFESARVRLRPARDA